MTHPMPGGSLAARPREGQHGTDRAAAGDAAPAEAIVVRALAARYRSGLWRSVQALDAVDLRVCAGEIVGVLGPNGSGKSTLFRVLAGVLRPRQGDVRVLGLPPADRTLVPHVGYQPEGALPFPQLSARELLAHLGNVIGLPAAASRARAGELLERLQLAHTGRQRLGTFSAGMTRRLALAAALLPRPRVLLLDEPTAALDPLGSAVAIELLREAAAGGAAVLLASHLLHEVEAACDRVYVLHRGRVHAHGTLDELLGTGDVELVVRGLQEDGVQAVRAAVTTAGGEVVAATTHREHLFALFRRLERR